MELSYAAKFWNNLGSWSTVAFLLIGAGVGFFAAWYLVRTLSFTIPLTTKLEARGIHSDPAVTRRRAHLGLAAVLALVGVVGIAAITLNSSSVPTIYLLVGVLVGALLPLALGRNLVVAQHPSLRRYIRANRQYLDPATLAEYIVETSQDPKWIKEVTQSLGANGYLAKDATVIQSAAAGGDAEAQFLLGMNYYMGRYDAANPSEAMLWITRAAEQGHAAARVMRERMMETDKENGSNLIRAIMWTKDFSDMLGYSSGSGGGAGTTMPR